METSFCDTFNQILLFYPEVESSWVVPGPKNQFYVESKQIYNNRAIFYPNFTLYRAHQDLKHCLWQNVIENILLYYQSNESKYRLKVILIDPAYYIYVLKCLFMLKFQFLIRFSFLFLN